MALFERGGRTRKEDMVDKRGSVYVVIKRIGTGEDAAKGHPVKGNISRSLTVSGAKVSEVYEAVEGFLFGEEN